MKYLALLILILLLNFIITTAQTKLIQPIDSASAKISIEELKYITLQFIEVDVLKSVNILLKDKVELLKRTLADKNQIIELRDGIINTHKEEMESVKPNWWDKFTVGFGSAVAIILGLILLLK